MDRGTVSTIGSRPDERARSVAGRRAPRHWLIVASIMSLVWLGGFVAESRAASVDPLADDLAALADPDAVTPDTTTDTTATDSGGAPDAGSPTAPGDTTSPPPADPGTLPPADTTSPPPADTPPPPADKGHFHTESSEFWFILLGQIRYTIEGMPTFIADQGDIVYVPKQRWHLASLAGDGMSARLAMNGYPDLAHSFDAPDPGEASR